MKALWPTLPAGKKDPSVREYADGRLAEAGDRDDARRRHAAYFVSVAENDEQARVRGKEPTRGKSLDEDVNNLRAAILNLEAVNETSGFEQHGILGGDYLEHFRVALDLRRYQFKLTPQSKAISVAAEKQ